MVWGNETQRECTYHQWFCCEVVIGLHFHPRVFGVEKLFGHYESKVQHGVE